MPTLLYLGVLCIITAIIGGGLRMAGVDFPVMNSAKRQLLLAGFGILLILFSVASDNKEKAEKESQRAQEQQSEADRAAKDAQAAKNAQAAKDAQAAQERLRRLMRPVPQEIPREEPADLPVTKHQDVAEAESGTWTDPNTNLTWMRRGLLFLKPPIDAIKYCESLSLAGKHDWRLPSISEASTMIQHGPANPEGLYLKRDLYLPSGTVITSAVADPSSDWESYFRGGVVYDRNSVICVRGGL